MTRAPHPRHRAPRCEEKRKRKKRECLRLLKDKTSQIKNGTCVNLQGYSQRLSHIPRLITNYHYRSLVYLLVLLIHIIFKLNISTVVFHIGLILILLPVAIAKVFFQNSNFIKWLEKERKFKL